MAIMSAARALRVEDHVKLVHHTIRRCKLDRVAEGCRGLDYDDIAQAGMTGLMRAIDKFRPELGNQFSTYATWWIRQAVLREIQNAGANVRVPVHRQEERRAKGERPTPGMRSLSDPVCSNADGREVTLGDVLADDAADPTARIEREQDKAELARLLDQAKLTDRERLVLRRRSEGVPLLEIGAGLGVTRERE